MSLLIKILAQFLIIGNCQAAFITIACIVLMWAAKRVLHLDSSLMELMLTIGFIILEFSIK